MSQVIIKSIAKMVFDDVSFDLVEETLKKHCDENRVDFDQLKQTIAVLVNAVRDYREFELRHAKLLAESISDSCFVTKEQLNVLLNGTMNELGIKEEKSQVASDVVEEKMEENSEAASEDYAEKAFNKGKDCVSHGDFFGAIKWFEDAAKMNHSEAAYALGNLYYYGNPAVEKNEDAAIEWYSKAVTLGNGAAEVAIAEIEKKREKAEAEAERKQREREETERKQAEAERKRRKKEEAERKRMQEERMRIEEERKRKEEELRKAETEGKKKQHYIKISKKPTVVHATNETIHQIVRNEIKLLGKDANLNHIDVSKVTSFFDEVKNGGRGEGLFEDTDFCGDVSKWDVGKVTNMQSLFSNCRSFNGDLSDWDVSNVEDMSYMFRECRSFDQDLSDWDLSSVEHMEEMFFNCKRFEGRGLEMWNVRNENMSFMFDGCDRINPDEYDWYVVSDILYGDASFYDDRCNPCSKYYEREYANKLLEKLQKEGKIIYGEARIIQF